MNTRFFVVILIFMCNIFYGATYYVSTTGNDTWSGNETHPWASVGTHLYGPEHQNVLNGDIIFIQNGTYQEPPIALTGLYYTGKNVTIIGENVNAVILNLTETRYGFYPDDAGLIISNLTMINNLYDAQTESACITARDKTYLNVNNVICLNATIAIKPYFTSGLISYGTIQNSYFDVISPLALSYGIYQWNNLTLINNTFDADIMLTLFDQNHIYNNKTNFYNNTWNTEYVYFNKELFDNNTFNYIGIEFQNINPEEKYYYENKFFNYTMKNVTIYSLISFVNSSNIVLNNISFCDQNNYCHINSSSNKAIVISDSDCSNITIKNSKFHFNKIDEYNLKIINLNGDNSIIENNVVYLNLSSGIGIHLTGNNNIIQNNTIYIFNNSISYGIGCGSEVEPPTGRYSNCKILNNTVYANYDNLSTNMHTYFLGYTNGSLFSNNIQYGGGYGMVIKGNTDSIIENGFIYGPTNNDNGGIYEKAGINNIFRNYYIELDTEYPIYFYNNLEDQVINSSWYNITINCTECYVNVRSPSSISFYDVIGYTDIIVDSTCNLTKYYSLNINGQENVEFEIKDALNESYYNNTNNYSTKYFRSEYLDGIETVLFYPYSYNATYFENYVREGVFNLIAPYILELPTVNPLYAEIISPVNDMYGNQTLLLNITNSSEVTNVWFNWNGTNYTYTEPFLIEFNHGENTIDVWVNNSWGDENYTNVTFTVYNPFISVWTLDIDHEIALPLIDSADDPTSEYNFYVDWGDDTPIQFIDSATSVNATHTYGLDNNYTIQMYGIIKGINFVFNNDKNKILEIQQWGDINLGNRGNYFENCENLNITATDILNLTGTTNLEGMFKGTNLTNVSNINLWDVSQVTNMRQMFSSAENFNQSLNDWDVSNVTNMNGMFSNALYFNQPLNNWNTSKVTDMGEMFTEAQYFNQSLNDWDVSNVENMEVMFAFTSYDHPLNNWNVSKVNNTFGMFALCLFNQSLNDWDVSNVENMAAMFMYAIMFDQPLNNWNTSKVKDMSGMFMYSQAFNQSLDDWDMSNVNSTAQMFAVAVAFNHPLENWDISNIKNMNSMFANAEAFNQPLGMWGLSSVEDMNDIFDEVTLSKENYDNTIIGWVNQTPNIPSNVSLGYVNSYYCTSEDARTELEINYNWTFDDLGKDCGANSQRSSTSDKEEPKLDYIFDCETGILEIESERNIKIRLMNLRDFSTYKNTTNNNGIVSFTLARDGTYRIFTESTSEYYSLQKDIILEFCEEEIVIIIPEINDTNDTNETEVIIPEVNETEMNVSEIEDLIELVNVEILKGIEENKNVLEAQQKLNQAKVEFNNGNYDLAEQLTNEALVLIMNAEAQQPELNETGIEGNQTEIPTENEVKKDKGFDWLLLIISGIILLILIVLGLKFLKSKN